MKVLKVFSVQLVHFLFSVSVVKCVLYSLYFTCIAHAIFISPALFKLYLRNFSCTVYAIFTSLLCMLIFALLLLHCPGYIYFSCVVFTIFISRFLHFVYATFTSLLPTSTLFLTNYVGACSVFCML